MPEINSASMMSGFNSASLFTKLVLFATPVVLVMFIVGFSTDSWVSLTGHGHYGLWFLTAADGNIGAKWIATQVMEVVGLLAGTASVGLIFLFVFMPELGGKKSTCILTILALLGAGGASIIGSIVWRTFMDSAVFLGWSYWLSTVAGALFGILGIIMFIAYRGESSTMETDRKGLILGV